MPTRAILMFVVMLANSAPLAVAQVSDHGDVEAAPYEVSGEALPKYYVVMGFLEHGFSVYEKSLSQETGGRPRFHQFLDEVGLLRDESTEEITIVGLQEAAIELQERTFDVGLADQPEAFRADQHARLLAKARRLGEIYGKLLTLYLESGMTPQEIATIDARIDEVYRPRYSLFWKPKPGATKPNPWYLVRSQEFERAVDRYYDTQTLTGWKVIPRAEK